MTFTDMVDEELATTPDIPTEPSRNDPGKSKQSIASSAYSEENQSHLQRERRNDSHVHIEHTARNGLITAIGVLLGFALTFLTEWGSARGDWKPVAYPMLSGLFLGVPLITAALALLIVPYRPTVAQYKRAVKIFLLGISIMFIGIFISIAATLPGIERFLFWQR